MPRVLHVLTVPDSLVFLDGQVDFMKRRGWDVTVVTSPGPELDAFGERHGVTTRAVDMPRRISPALDAKSLARLAWMVRRSEPDLVHAHTPKGGLLGTLAATIARVPARIYHMRGLPMMTASGRRRDLLRSTEIVSCRAATRVIANSASLRDFAIREGLVAADKILVLGRGSGNGVDCARFDPERLPDRRDLRRELVASVGASGSTDDTLLVGFVGRLVTDKGVADLTRAWRDVVKAHPNARLLVAGRFEERDALPASTQEELKSDPTISLLGFVEDTPRLLRALDVLVLPTYREGFPNVLLEASAMRVPIVATRVPGCVDAVVDGVTGTLVPPRDEAALGAAISCYLASPSLRRRHGDAGRDHVVSHFRRERLWQALAEVYEGELARVASRRARRVWAS